MGIESGSRVESSLYWPRRGLACGDDGIWKVEERNKWGREGVLGVVEGALGDGGTDEVDAMLGARVRRVRNLSNHGQCRRDSGFVGVVGLATQPRSECEMSQVQGDCPQAAIRVHL